MNFEKQEEGLEMILPIMLIEELLEFADKQLNEVNDVLTDIQNNNNKVIYKE